MNDFERLRSQVLVQLDNQLAMLTKTFLTDSNVKMTKTEALGLLEIGLVAQLVGVGLTDYFIGSVKWPKNITAMGWPTVSHSDKPVNEALKLYIDGADFIDRLCKDLFKRYDAKFNQQLLAQAMKFALKNVRDRKLNFKVTQTPEMFLFKLISDNNDD